MYFVHKYYIKFYEKNNRFIEIFLTLSYFYDTINISIVNLYKHPEFLRRNIKYGKQNLGC